MTAKRSVEAAAGPASAQQPSHGEPSKETSAHTAAGHLQGGHAQCEAYSRSPKGLCLPPPRRRTVRGQCPPPQCSIRNTCTSIYLNGYLQVSVDDSTKLREVLDCQAKGWLLEPPRCEKTSFAFLNRHRHRIGDLVPDVGTPETPRNLAYPGTVLGEPRPSRDGEAVAAHVCRFVFLSLCSFVCVFLRGLTLSVSCCSTLCDLPGADGSARCWRVLSHVVFNNSSFIRPFVRPGAATGVWFFHRPGGVAMMFH